MRILIGLLLVVGLLAGCASKQPYADDATVAAVSYRDTANPSIILVTMINNRSGAGAHSALIVNASERILFDPAGSFYLDIVPERNDVLFGISPRIQTYYVSSHARSSHHVVLQEIPVTSQQAQVAYQLALSNGAVPGAFCASATSGILRQVPGFEGISQTLFPKNLMEQVAEIPGVTTQKFYEGDDPDLQAALARGIEG